MMNHQTVIRSLKSKSFTKIINKGEWFESGATIYAKEIKDNIYLIFVMLKDVEFENIKALIAHFECFSNIGIKEPTQIMFYLSIQEKEDLHYFKKYLRQQIKV
ncbi:hypothetical protein [Chryseobacterium sp.]|uniref:hypothetical protein n=1 Tax=Chryseobacterium sp. TaxID=1871047 RepID=UPI00289EEE58|nr:hypothetical protein [Chryseobacterium sp.]